MARPTIKFIDLVTFSEVTIHKKLRSGKIKKIKELTNKKPKVGYAPEKENLLIKNALTYKSVIGNKLTNSATNWDNEKAWEKITMAFNVAPTGKVIVIFPERNEP